MKTNKPPLSPLVYFHADLDGIVSYLTLCWYLNQKLEYVATTTGRLKEDWSKHKHRDSKIYFLDLDVSSIGEEIDRKGVFIFDHHKTNSYEYINAVPFIYNETSCSKLIHNTLSKVKSVKLTNAQKTLIALADDVDSYTNATPISNDLNIVYHNTHKKVESFIEDYWDGFKPFDKYKLNIISSYKRRLKEHLKALSLFKSNKGIVIDGKEYSAGAVFSEDFIQESSEYVFKKLPVDIAIVVMISKNRIAVRRNRLNDTADVSKFVQEIANGGGHEAAAGGELTKEFMELAKTFSPC